MAAREGRPQGGAAAERLLFHYRSRKLRCGLFRRRGRRGRFHAHGLLLPARHRRFHRFHGGRHGFGLLRFLDYFLTRRAHDLDSEVAPDQVRHIFINGAGVRLFLGDTKLRQQVDDPA
jgi:hypothetical protein